VREIECSGMGFRVWDEIDMIWKRGGNPNPNPNPSPPPSFTNS